MKLFIKENIMIKYHQTVNLANLLVNFVIALFNVFLVLMDI